MKSQKVFTVSFYLQVRKMTLATSCVLDGVGLAVRPCGGRINNLKKEHVKIADAIGAIFNLCVV